MDQLTEREKEVADLFADDLQDAQIARKAEWAAFQAGLCLGGIGGVMVGAIIAVAANGHLACGLRVDPNKARTGFDFSLKPARPLSSFL